MDSGLSFDQARKELVERRMDEWGVDPNTGLARDDHQKAIGMGGSNGAGGGGSGEGWNGWGVIKGLAGGGEGSVRL